MLPVSLRFVKEAATYGMQMDLESALLMGARLFAACFTTEDREEGIRAFIEKGNLTFKGK